MPLSFRDFVDYARRFAEESEDPRTQSEKARTATASFLFSWIAIEAFINGMMADFAALPPGTFTEHERGFLEERAVEFVTEGEALGTFRVANRPEFRRLEEKIMFLIAKFGGGTRLDKGSTLWQKFESLKEQRNRLTHPRRDKPVTLTSAVARDALSVAQEIIRVVSVGVWGKQTEF